MSILSGITNIFQHVSRLFASVMSWFSGINWSAWTDILPVQFSDLVLAFMAVLVTLAAIGLIKKLSFLLG